MWDPAIYEEFALERERAWWDLLARVGTLHRSIVDLGAGTGRLTATLATKYPSATVVGVENAPAMLARAPTGIANLRMNLGNIEDFVPDGSQSLLIANASLQWLSRHDALLPRLVKALPAGGQLAVQMPSNSRSPATQIIRRALSSQPYAAHLADVAKTETGELNYYTELLLGSGCAVDAWETTYFHVLQGERAALRWLLGTTLRPAMTALPNALGASLTETLATELDRAYPTRSWGTLFPFRRIFFVATRR